MSGMAKGGRSCQVPVLLLARKAESKQLVLQYGSIGVLLTSIVWLAQRLMA